MKKYIYLVVVFFTLVIASCKKSYLDINENPNSPTEESITPALILPQALHTTAAQVGAGYSNVARWMGYWTRGGDYGPSQEEESYNITYGFGAGTWSAWYNNLNDYNIIETKARVAGQKFYEGIAKTMKTIGFMNLVDLYNNVPYTKAFDLTGNIQPTYDKGPAIYADMLVQLDNALVLIDADQPGQSPGLLNADIMFKGNPTLWKKFINTQRLRLLIHQSQIPGFSPAAQLAKVTTEGFLKSGETADVNPGYSQLQGKQNPFWDAYEQDYLGVFVDKYNRANNYVLNLLRNSGDIRYQYYFDPAQTPLGTNVYFGYDYGFVDPNPNNPKSVNSSGVGGKGLAKSVSQDQWLLTSIESLFLQAEAIQRGWNAFTPAFGTGTAKEAYENAVRESFIWLGVTDATATANTYLASGNVLVDWDASGNKIQRIITQKYLGMVGVNNLETWTDYRRTGFPAVPKSLSPSVASNIPLRYRYPLNEYNYNAANVAAENDPNPLTSGIFWDVN